MFSQDGRIKRELRTVEAMTRIYCRDHHGNAPTPCPRCSELIEYAAGRLGGCPYGAEKPVCSRCPVHCYKPAMRDRIRAVMRHAGPQMAYRHPVLAFYHIVDGYRNPPAAEKTAGKGLKKSLKGFRQRTDPG
jgi:hypothetical protein